MHGMRFSHAVARAAARLMGEGVLAGPDRVQPCSPRRLMALLGAQAPLVRRTQSRSAGEPEEGRVGSVALLRKSM